jgi:hypothetical protein
LEIMAWHGRSHPSLVSDTPWQVFTMISAISAEKSKA